MDKLEKAREIRNLLEEIESLEMVKEELDNSGFHSGNFNGIEHLRVAKTEISVKALKEDTNMRIVGAIKNIVSERLNDKLRLLNTIL